jgi:hypothetical protein
MDIHAPESPISSFKEFATHIGVVTCGIIIALALEAAVEAVHNRHLVRDTRETIHVEMQNNLDNTVDELRRVTLYTEQIKSLALDLPTLQKEHPEQIEQRLAKIVNPEYFFSATTWQSAISTGSQEHMSTDEVIAYAGAAESIKIYSDLQQHAMTQEDRSKAFFTARPHLTPDQLQQGTEDLILFYRAERSLSFVGPQMKRQIETAVRASAKY